MSEQIFEDAQGLSACETIIMKAIWDEDGDISIQNLIEVLKTKWGKDYARTTVVTFLLKLAAKGFVMEKMPMYMQLRVKRITRRSW